MANLLDNWQAYRLSKPLIVNVGVFPEAGLVATAGEKIKEKVPENSVVFVSITNPKSGQTFVPLLPQGQQQPAQHQPLPASQVVAKGVAQQQPHQGQKGGKKNTATYKPKANQPNSNAAQAGTSNASAANGGAPVNGGDARQGGAQQQQPRKNRNNSNSGNTNAPKQSKGKEKVVEEPAKVITAEDLKRQREEQAQHEAWLAQRRDFERKEREEQDRRYRERVARQQQLKKEKDEAEKKRRELEGEPKLEEEQQKEGEKESTGPKSCWVCNSDKHIARKCPSRCKRSNCNTNGNVHTMQNCKESCLLCKGKGHDEWYCEKRCPVCRRGTGDAHLLENCPVECRLCGAKGHRDRDCEYAYANREKKKSN